MFLVRNSATVSLGPVIQVVPVLPDLLAAHRALIAVMKVRLIDCIIILVFNTLSYKDKLFHKKGGRTVYLTHHMLQLIINRSLFN